MLVVNLSSLALFDKKQIKLLNDLIAVNRQLMPHILAVALGCRLEEAMALLIFLYDKSLANGFIVIYHSLHQEFYFARQPLKEGLPKTGEIFCQVCEDNIKDENELLYDFEFVINNRISFEV